MYIFIRSLNLLISTTIYRTTILGWLGELTNFGMDVSILGFGVWCGVVTSGNFNPTSRLLHCWRWHQTFYRTTTNCQHQSRADQRCTLRRIRCIQRYTIRCPTNKETQIQGTLNKIIRGNHMETHVVRQLFPASSHQDHVFEKNILGYTRGESVYLISNLYRFRFREELRRRQIERLNKFMSKNIEPTYACYPFSVLFTASAINST